MSLHADVLDVLAHWQAPDTGQDRLRASYAAHLAGHADGIWRSCFPAHL
ncbi:MAG: hydrolase, partial [Marmoricola sp.]|nr:hydrolase [Marmoricola sp.]